MIFSYLNIKERPFTKEYYYIAHLLDRVLIGKENKGTHNDLIEALKDSQVLELHLFNEEKEIFAASVDGQLHTYEYLEHKAINDERVICRCYKLDSGLMYANGIKNYKGLKVKEYIGFSNNMAYVKKTVLYKLVEEGENV